MRCAPKSVVVLSSLSHDHHAATPDSAGCRSAVVLYHGRRQCDSGGFCAEPSVPLPGDDAADTGAWLSGRTRMISDVARKLLAPNYTSLMGLSLGSSRWHQFRKTPKAMPPTSGATAPSMNNKCMQRIRGWVHRSRRLFFGHPTHCSCFV